MSAMCRDRCQAWIKSLNQISGRSMGITTPLDQAAQYAADRWADYLNQPGGAGSVFTDEIHRRQRSPIPPNEVARINAELYAYIVAWFLERQGYQQMILDCDYHMNDHLLAAIGCLVNPRDLPLKTWVRISRDECGHYRVSSSCGYMTGVTKAEFRNPNGGTACWTN